MQCSLTMPLQEKRDFYKSEINNIVAQAYNNEQKQLACDILDNATENNIDALYTFITQRVKLGFTFDAAPEVNHNCVALCKRNNKLSFGTLGNKHKMIIGENYDALKNLLVTYTKNGKGLIDVIYIDPPYNTEKSKEEGNDYKDEVESKKFIYRDKFTRNGWLNLMRERLIMARKLLSDKGVIFISIDDTEQAYLKILCDGVFGEENFVGNIIWNKKSGGGQTDEFFVKEHEYISVYRKTNLFKWIDETIPKEMIGFNGEDEQGKFTTVKLAKWGSAARREDRPTMYFPIKNPDGKNVFPIAPDNSEGRWRIGKKRMEITIEKNNIHWEKREDTWVAYEKVYYDEKAVKVIKSRSIFIDVGETGDGTKMLTKIFGSKDIFPNPKPVELIKELLLHCENSIVLDFFAGSGTTGQAVMELNQEDGRNRKCILVANNENNIGKEIMYERIFRVVNGEGTKGEKFTWTYSKDKPYLTENSWDVFEIEYNELKIDDFDKAEKLLKQAEPEFKALNSEYENNGLDIYNQLASLNPYKKDGK